MPSKKPRTAPAQTKPKSITKVDHSAFWPLVLLGFIVWVVYRSVFHFDVWFDEIIGKALFFGFPVWLYVSLTRSYQVVETFAPPKVYRGLWLGVAWGGIYGFATSLLAMIMNQSQVQSAVLFSSGAFWWEFFLAMMTGFWETIFFYSWIMVVIQDKYQRWSLFKQVVVVAAVFLAFHVPNTLLRFSGQQVFIQLSLLFLFGLGQALLFASRRNAFALAVSHAIWGMVLLVHLS